MNKGWGAITEQDRREKWDEEATHHSDNGGVGHTCIPDLLGVLPHGLSSGAHNECWVHSSLYRRARYTESLLGCQDPIQTQLIFRSLHLTVFFVRGPAQPALPIPLPHTP